MEEIFKPIKGYEDYYSISNKGRVYSHKTKTYLKPKRNENKKTGSIGYWQVDLCVKQKHTYPFIHRLVAEAFIDNPNNYNQVNHIDENRENNDVSNLEWCDSKYNLYYGSRIEKISYKNRERCKVGIVMIDKLNGEILETFECIADVERKYGYSHSNIIKCCKHQIKSAYGYIWKYLDSGV